MPRISIALALLITFLAGPSHAADDSTPSLTADDSSSSQAADDSPSHTADDSTPADGGPASLPGLAAPIDYLWVVRTSLTDRASVDSVVARAKEVGVTGILVQVVGRGDAYYDSDVLPRAEALADSPDLDPLAEIIWRAHLAGLEVHAWINTLLVWSAPDPPEDPRHVVLSHPEWIAVLDDGRPMSELSVEERTRMGVEGVFLSPAAPGVSAWVGSIAAEIARRYPVSGVHLDYIRHPKAPVGYDRTTRLLYAMEDGLSPAQLRAPPPAHQAKSDRAWQAFRAEQITAVVAAVRESLTSVRPGVMLSAAVIADSLHAADISAQAWPQWLHDGLVDRVFPMVYAPPVQTVMDQLQAFAADYGVSGRLVPGIAIFNTSPTRAALKILGARALGYPLVALYSYDSLFAAPERWPELRTQLERAPR